MKQALITQIVYSYVTGKTWPSSSLFEIISLASVSKFCSRIFSTREHVVIDKAQLVSHNINSELRARMSLPPPIKFKRTP